MLRRDEIVAVLKAHEAELRARGVQGLFLFGSVGRGEARASNVDLFFDIDRASVWRSSPSRSVSARSSQARSTSPRGAACIRSCASGSSASAVRVFDAPERPEALAP